MLPDIPLIRVLAFSHFWHFRNAGSSLTQLHPSVCLPGPGVAVWNLPRLYERASECKTFSVEVREREVKFWMQEHKPWNARIFGTRIAKARLRNAGTLDGRPSLHIISWLHLPTFTMCFMIISAIAGGVLSPGTGSINLS